MPARRSCTPLDTFTGLTVLFMLVLTLDLPEIRAIWVGTKFANPAKFLLFYPSYTNLYLTTFKRETTQLRQRS